MYVVTICKYCKEFDISIICIIFFLVCYLALRNDMTFLESS